MKKLLFVALLLPLFTIGQEKDIVFTARLFPEPAKIIEFEKALGNHHQKFHSGDWKAHVFSVISGPDAGAYHITMGPLSWQDLDNRKPTAEHDMDWKKNVLPHVRKSTGVGFAKYHKDLSTIPVGDFVDKVTLFRVYPLQGNFNSVNSLIKRAKADWVNNNYSVAVYTNEASGDNHFTMVTRHKNGWAEKGKTPSKSFKESLGGDMEMEDFMNDVRKSVKNAYGEMMVRLPDLSSR